jgi:hypothetical protein
MSGNALLDLRLSVTGVDHSDAITLITKHSDRWKHIRIHGSHAAFFIEVFNPLFLPTLTLLALSSLYIYQSATMRHSPRIYIPSAPNLRTLVLRVIEDFDDIHLPWEQLEVLTFIEISLPALFVAFPKCTSIRKVTLSSVHFNSQRPEIQIPSLDLPSSTTLIDLHFVLFKEDTYLAMKDCFDKLTLPTLKKFHIEVEVGILSGKAYYPSPVPEWPVDSFRAFVKRSGFTLTTMCMVRFPIGDLNIISVLECLPHLQELVLIECSNEKVKEENLHFLTNYLMSRLRVGLPSSRDTESNPSDARSESEDYSLGAPNPTLVPCLKHLKLEGKGSPKSFSFESFIDMVKSRRRSLEGSSVLSLKKVELRVSHQPIGKAIQEEIDGLSSDESVLNVVGSACVD